MPETESNLTWVLSVGILLAEVPVTIRIELLLEFSNSPQHPGG